MFSLGFEKVAYSRKEHHLDQMDVDTKHWAKKDPVKGAVGLTAGGTLLGAGMGALGHHTHVAKIKKLKNGNVSFNVKPLAGKALRASKLRGAGKGALVGSLMGGLMGLAHAHGVKKSKELQEMSPETRRAYLSGMMGY